MKIRVKNVLDPEEIVETTEQIVDPQNKTELTCSNK